MMNNVAGSGSSSRVEVGPHVPCTEEQGGGGGAELGGFGNSPATRNSPETRNSPVLDTVLRLGVGPHAPRTEEQGGGRLNLDLTMSMSSPLTSLKHNNEHVRGMLEGICKHEKASVVKEKDKEIIEARARIAELEQRVKTLENTNHTLREALDRHMSLQFAVLVRGGGIGVPTQQTRDEEPESSSVLGRP